MLINFADKAIIGLAAAPIMRDLHLSPRQFGLVGSSFFLLFAVSAVIVGFISNRVQSRLPEAGGAGEIAVTGDAMKFAELMGLMDEFPRIFEIVEPKRGIVA